ncbi:MAG: hypothetical protein IPO48_14915 [Saprospiraceae bacterium]|nr:hypothetical protein [Saprospiraceae bacterium]
MFNVVGIQSIFPFRFANLRSSVQQSLGFIWSAYWSRKTLYVDNVYFTTLFPAEQIPATSSNLETSGLLNNDGIICQATATLTASGGGTYAWSTGATTAQLQQVPCRNFYSDSY